MSNKAAKQFLQPLLNTYKYCMQCASPLSLQQLDDEPRLACSNSNCDFVHWNNPTPVMAALVEYVESVDQQGKFILAHNVAWPAGKYSVITGFLESEDSSVEQGIRREVKEELNLEALSYHYIGHYSSVRANQLILAFHIKARGDIKLNEELDDYKLIAFDKIIGWESETGRSVGDYILQREAGLLSCHLYEDDET